MPKARTLTGSIYTYTEVGQPVLRQSDHEVFRTSGFDPVSDSDCVLTSNVVVGLPIVMDNLTLGCLRITSTVVEIIDG